MAIVLLAIVACILVPLPALSRRIEISLTTKPIVAIASMPLAATCGGWRNRPTASTTSNVAVSPKAHHNGFSYLISPVPRS